MAGWRERILVRLVFAVAGVGFGLGVLDPAGAVEVEFRSPGYVAMVGGAVELEVVIRYGPGEPADLFSYGVRMVPESLKGVEVLGIEVPPELDYRAFGQPAQTDSAPEVMGAKGNVELPATMPEDFYAGELVVRYTVVFHTLGEHRLGLDFYRTAGPNENVFVSGDQTVLDALITFGSTTVEVVEPPQLRAEAVTDGVRLSFELRPGFDYTLVRSDSPAGPWEDLSTTSGDDFSAVSFVVPTAGAAARFFALQVVSRSG